MKDVFQLIYNEDTDRYELDGYDLHCGDCLSVLVWNGLTGKAEFVDTRMECNSKGWYLVGLVGYQIDGLFATAEWLF